MSEAVVVFLIAWFPAVVLGTFATPLLAEWKGRSMQEGLILGFVGGIAGLLLEAILPSRGELTQEDAALLPSPVVADAPRRLRVGWLVFLGLGILTAVEYAVAVTVNKNVPVLAFFAFPKAALIIFYFMHVTRSWSEEH